MSFRLCTLIKPEMADCFGHLGAAETNCEPCIDISALKVDTLNTSANSDLFFSVKAVKEPHYDSFGVVFTSIW